MSEREEKIFHISYAELIGLCNKTKTFVLRDLSEFAAFGIDQQFVDDFDEQINEYEVFEWDEDKRARIVTKTQEKDKLREEVNTMLKELAQRGKLAFEPGSTAGQCFAIGSITKLNDSKFLVEARRLKRDAEQYLTELAVFGLTQAIIDELDAKNTAFENALEEQSEAKASRKEKTTERIAKGNALYRKMRMLCDIGQTIWYEKSEAHWNDYIYYTGAKYNKKKKNEDDGE